ncbi:hypothetical protein CRYUN_Cryun37aG0056800 [Craigia yunnanensis]
MHLVVVQNIINQVCSHASVIQTFLTPRCHCRRLFSLTNTSPPSGKPSTSLAKQSRSPPIEIQPCESHLPDIDACIGYILNAFLTNEPNVGPACCKAITEISQDCFNGLIPPFISQFFGPFIKELCSVPPCHA